jgi:two-component system response regulator
VHVMEQTVLIVDDNPNDVLITKRILSKVAPAVGTEVAPNGETALAALHDGLKRPALILLDLKMPGMDGVEVLRRLRADDELRNIPVIIMTHSALESDITASYEAGASGFLHKAFDIEQFGMEMKQLLDRWLKN